MNYRGLNIPRASMGGRMTTDDLFGPNEQVIFDFYEANRDRYRRAADVGANVGVHSILMAHMGWEVWAYEPDPGHFIELRKNLTSHGFVMSIGTGGSVATTCAAVSDRGGIAKFVRVLNNLTGNHLVGAKDSYGPREEIAVSTVDCRPIFAWADFVKVDCEGHEAVIIEALPALTWEDTDCLLEVGSLHSASIIHSRLRDVVPMWAQHRGWGRVQNLRDMPQRHQDGSLFIGRDPPFGREHDQSR